jgi:transposase InsO family protein
MPWLEVSKMQLRKEFVGLALQEGQNIRQLCRQFGISPTTGYKWLKRFFEESGVADRSCRPVSSPGRSPAELEAKVVALRRAHPAWGARKLKHRLQAQGHAMPAVSTVHAILVRQGCIEQASGLGHAPWQRFEHAAPNDLWQMDFKGHVGMRQGRCHPLTVLDDHSRYALCLSACGNEQQETVQGHLIATFRRYGLPQRMTMDNGSPWGDTQTHYTAMDVWLMKQGIRVSHSRPYHPQTQGKDERFHRSLKAEVLQGAPFCNLEQAQKAFDHWRQVYNQQRPHEALGMQVPQQRYRTSPAEYRSAPPPPEYTSQDGVRKVQAEGEISWQNHSYRIGKAFVGERIAIRPTLHQGQYDVFWSVQRIATINSINHSVISGKRIP